MMNFITLDEIIEVKQDGSATARPIYIKVTSINSFRKTSYGGLTVTTQVNLQNDCVFVTNTPDEIMDRCFGMMPDEAIS